MYKLDHNGNPAPEAWREIAETLRVSVERYPEMKLDMTEGRVKERHHACGTTHCFAGAYVLGAVRSEVIEESDVVGYLSGIELIVRRLGFKNSDALEKWGYMIQKNARIWGNSDGDLMFRSASAFNYAQSVSEIADYLDGVADRQETFNKKEVKGE